MTLYRFEIQNSQNTIIENIEEWIITQLKRPINRTTYAVHKSFDFVTMSDGRKAQIKVTLELDEEEWDE